MNLKEHLQFFAMMIPTFLLLGAAALTLALPEKTVEEPAAVAGAVQDTEIGPIQTVVIASE